MMKKIPALLISLVMILSMGFTADAAETFSVVLGENVTVSVNGDTINSNTTVSEKDKLMLTTEDEDTVAVVVDGVYYPVRKAFTPVADLDLSKAMLCSLGLKMVDGAQVRVGAGKVTENGKLDNTADSGLRFLATCDYNDTVIADGNVEFGIKVSAEGSDASVYVKAEKFQDDDATVFTAAVTNLAESNYNRNYTASAYARVPMYDGSVQEFEAGEVTRSIYQVSVGILKNSSAEFNDNLPYTIDDAVKDVLAAYVNQSGIRLNYSKDGTMSARTTGTGAYTGDLYFNVESALQSDGSTFVTVTPLGESDGFFNSVIIPTWWKEYIRINNNNSVAASYISEEKLEDGVLSFKFALPESTDYSFNQDDSVTVVSEVAKDYIKGFKAGEEVTYPLSETVTVMGLAKTMKDVVPGSVIMVGCNKDNEVAAVELLASIGIPVDPDIFEASFGVYNAGDGSSKYKNIVSQVTAKSGSRVTCQNLPDTTKVVYRFESTSSMCYRVGIAMSGDTPEITVKSEAIKNGFSGADNDNYYAYLRYDSTTERVKECVYYCVPEDFDFSGDGEYSDIFSLDDYKVILE